MLEVAKVIGLCLSSLLITAHAAAQPRITAVVNGASFERGVAPGSFATIFGERLAGSTNSINTAEWPTSLGGVTVLVNGRAAPLHSVSPSQVNFQVPASTPQGEARAEVRFNGSVSEPAQFTVFSAAPGILTSGADRAVIQNQDGSLNAPQNGAAPGSTIVVYMTGIGEVDHPVADGLPTPGGPLARSTLRSSASIGLIPANISFLGLTPGFVGLAQANIVVPNAAAGQSVIDIRVGDRSAKRVTLSIAKSAANLLVPLNRVNLSGGPLNARFQNGFLYVCAPSGITIFDGNRPGALFPGGLFGADGGYCDLGGDLIVTSSAGQGVSQLNVFSVATPGRVEKAGGPFNLPPFVQNISLTKRHAMVSSVWYEVGDNPSRVVRQHGELFSVNLSDPMRLTLASRLSTQAGHEASGSESPFFSQLKRDDETLYLLSTTNRGGDTNSGVGRLVIVDTGNPANLMAAGQLSVPNTNTLNCGALESNLALIVGSTSSWTSPGDLVIRGQVSLSTLDVANSRDPKIIASTVTAIRSSFASPSCVSLGGGWFAFTAWPDPAAPWLHELIIVDARDPANPRIAHVETMPNLLERGLVREGDYLYAIMRSSILPLLISR